MWRRDTSVMQHHAAPLEAASRAYHPCPQFHSNILATDSLVDPERPSPGQSQLPFNTPDFASIPPRKSHTLAFRRASYFLALLSALLFFALAFTLAFPRFAPRLSNLVSQFRPPKAWSSSSRPLSSVSMAPARYQHPPQAPPCFTATPESLLEDTKRLVAGSKRLQDDIVENVSLDKATFENTVLRMSRTDDKDGLESHIIGFYQAISTSKALRDASTEAEKLMDQFAIDS